MNDNNQFVIAIIAAAATLFGVVLAFGLNIAWDLWTDRKKTNEARNQLASALLSEITVLQERFDAVFGKAIEEWKENEEPRFGGVVRATNLFVVFDQNASKLGLFEKKDTHIVIRAYTLTKTFVESVNAVSEVRQQDTNQMVAYRASNNLDALNAVGAILLSYTNRMVPLLKKEWQDVVYTTNDAKRVLEQYAS